MIKPSPCGTCPKQNECPHPCDAWKSWFRAVWAKIRRLNLPNGGGAK